MMVLNDFSEAVEEIGREIEKELTSSDERVVVAIAGTSASGKSYFANMLKNYLKEKAIESFYINADNFYKKTTPFYVEFYESFDHKDTIDLEELKEVVKKVKNKEIKTISLPVYSFEKATRVGYEQHDLGNADVVIVEGIYVLNVLHDIAHFPIYVASTSPIKEVMRRFIRDTEGERLKLDPAYVLKLLVGAYLMFDLFGKEQVTKCRYLVKNNYDVLENTNLKEWSSVKVLNLDEFSQQLKESGWWYFYEDEDGVEFIIHEEINNKIRIFLKSQKGVLCYEFDSGKEFMLLHLLAKIIGLKLYKRKETSH
ncbi:MAG: hypothetical protein GXN99_03420 [Candidatus Nanohaloarchaeota archaeon]|nr:hypothetical protein [Candidatus Nanohaloarchaeota archaeon]